MAISGRHDFHCPEGRSLGSILGLKSPIFRSISVDLGSFLGELEEARTARTAVRQVVTTDRGPSVCRESWGVSGGLSRLL